MLSPDSVPCSFPKTAEPLPLTRLLYMPEKEFDEAADTVMVESSSFFQVPSRL
jgi:hypothetical protein